MRRPAGVMRLSGFLHPLPAILEMVIELIKVRVIMKTKPTTFIQTSTHVVLSKQGQKALWYTPIKNLTF